MENFKKVVLYIAGPGVVIVEIVAVFIHLFTESDGRPWIIGGLVVFFIGFVPLYSVEYFRQNFKETKTKRSVRFRKKNKRTVWEGGNVHGSIAKKVEGRKNLFDKNS